MIYSWETWGPGWRRDCLALSSHTDVGRSTKNYSSNTSYFALHNWCCKCLLDQFKVFVPQYAAKPWIGSLRWSYGLFAEWTSLVSIRKSVHTHSSLYHIWFHYEPINCLLGTYISNHVWLPFNQCYHMKEPVFDIQ